MTQKHQASLLKGLDSEQQGWPSNPRMSKVLWPQGEESKWMGKVEKARFLDEMSLCGISNSEKRPAVTLCWPRWRWDGP